MKKFLKNIYNNAKGKIQWIYDYIIVVLNRAGLLN